MKLKKASLLGLALVTLISTINIDNLVFAESLSETNDVSEPTLNIYKSGDYVKAEWAVDILPQDVLYQTGFEDDNKYELPELVYGSIDKGGGRTGGQSFSIEDSYDGLRSLRIEDTYKNGQQAGNPINGVVPFSDSSRARFLEKKYIDNGIDLSLSFKVKTKGSGTIKPEAQGVKADYGINMKETFIEDVVPGSLTVKVSDVTIFKNAIDKGMNFYLADRKGEYTTIHAKDYDEKESTITLNAPFYENFKKDERLIQHRAVVPLSFPIRTVNSSEWETVNMNTKVPSYPYFNIKKNGFTFVLFNTTRGIIYIDDLKMGFATQTELYRNGLKVYEGKLSDFEDKKAIDTTRPDEVLDYNVSLESGVQYINLMKPKDNGTNYNYQLKAISNDGSGAYWSNSESLNIISGIKGYSYVIDDKTNTNPNGVINNTNGVIKVDDEVYKNHYLHIQSIDEAGNKSDVSHIKLDKVKDIIKPKIEVSHDTTWTNKSVELQVNAVDYLSGIKEFFVVGADQVKNGDFKEGDKHWHGGNGEDPVYFKDGSVILKNNNVSRDKLNQSLFKDEISDSLHYVEVEARGDGVLNARRGVSGGSPVDSFVKVNNKDNFDVFRFIVEKHETSNSSLVVERIGKEGYLEIKSVKVHEQRDLKDTSIMEVSENGKFTFVAEDNEGNISTHDYEVSNIDIIPPSVDIVPNTKEITHENVILNINAEDNESGIKNITYLGEKWIEEFNLLEEIDITNSRELEVTENGEYTFVVEDNAGNITTEIYLVDNIVKELTFGSPKIDKNVSMEISDKLNAEIDVSDFEITDWRDNNNNWRLTLEASPLKSDKHQLSSGSINFKGVNEVVKADGDNKGELNINSQRNILDEGPIELITSIGSRGIHKVNLKDNPVEFNISTREVRKGSYNTKLTWTLESTPVVN